jgi:ribosomal protein L40E
MVALAAFQVSVSVAAAATPTEETTASEADLSGYRLCPHCNTLNPPEADYCMRCGAALAGRTEEAVAPRAVVVKGFALSPFGFAGNYEAAGGGLRGRFGGRSWSYSPSYAYDARWPGVFYDNHQHHLLGNEGRFYFGGAALRPFLGGAFDAEYYHYEYHYYPGYERESHRFVVSAGFGGGLELNYDPRGSFFDIRGFAGPAVTWTGGNDDYSRTFAYFSFQIGNVTYFNQHVGLGVRLAANSGTGYYSENRIILEIGPSFAW